MINRLKLKQYAHEFKIIGISAILSIGFVCTASFIMYSYIPKQPTVTETGSITVIKDYYISGIDGNIIKHAYILVDRDTNIMYLSIDTIQDGKVVATSQSELYGKDKNLMTYKEFLNDDEIKFKADSLNDKVKKMQQIPPPNKEGENNDAGKQ